MFLKNMLHRVLFVSLFFRFTAVTLKGQSKDAAQQARMAMEASLKRQQASVRLQLSRQTVRQQLKVRSMTTSVAPAVQLSSAWIGTPSSLQCSAVAPEVLMPQIEQAAAQQGVSSDLLRAVAHAESSFVPCATSPKGARGLMQIMPATGRELGLLNPWDPQQSLLAGAKYLRQLLDRYDGNIRLALGAYNAGPAKVDRYGGVPPIEETQAYVRRIMSEFNGGAMLDIEDPEPLQ